MNCRPSFRTGLCIITDARREFNRKSRKNAGFYPAVSGRTSMLKL